MYLLKIIIGLAFSLLVGSAQAANTYTPNLGTPSVLNLQNATGLPLSGITGINSGVLTALGLSLNGTGSLVATSAVVGKALTANNSEIVRSLASEPAYTYPVAFGTLFQGDFSSTVLPYQQTVCATCAPTLTTGYSWHPVLSATVGQGINNGGSNHDTGDNGGRTGIALAEDYLSQNGGGDYVDRHVYMQLTSTNPAATNFLASPEIGLLAADLGATVAGGYLQGIGDVNFDDNGFDSAAIGTTYNFIRTNNTAVLGEIWLGEYFHSSGSKPIDAAWALNGPANVGLDTVQASALHAAVNMAQGQKILLDSTACAIGGINWYGCTYGSSSIFKNASNQVEIDEGGHPGVGFGWDATFGYAQIAGVSTVLEIAGSTGGSGGVYTPGYMNVGGTVLAFAFTANGSSGVSCSGAPTASYATVNGIVTHC